jgi:hypothetical protein
MKMSDPEWVEDLLEDLAAAATGDLCHRREPPGSTTRAEQVSRAEGYRPDRSAVHESATHPRHRASGEQVCRGCGSRAGLGRRDVARARRAVAADTLCDLASAAPLGRGRSPAFSPPTLSYFNACAGSVAARALSVAQHAILRSPTRR